LSLEAISTRSRAHNNHTCTHTLFISQTLSFSLANPRTIKYSVKLSKNFENYILKNKKKLSFKSYKLRLAFFPHFFWTHPITNTHNLYLWSPYFNMLYKILMFIPIYPFVKKKLFAHSFTQQLTHSEKYVQHSYSQRKFIYAYISIYFFRIHSFISNKIAHKILPKIMEEYRYTRTKMQVQYVFRRKNKQKKLILIFWRNYNHFHDSIMLYYGWQMLWASLNYYYMAVVRYTKKRIQVCTYGY